MGISNTGKKKAFESGLINVIDNIRLFGTSGQIGSQKSVTMDKTSVNGELELPQYYDFDVSADETVTNVRLFDSNDLIWTIDLNESYTFDVDGIFRVENAQIRFLFDTLENLYSSGGLSRVGADHLIDYGWETTVGYFRAYDDGGAGSVELNEQTSVYNKETGTEVSIDSDIFFYKDTDNKFSIKDEFYVIQFLIDEWDGQDVGSFSLGRPEDNDPFYIFYFDADVFTLTYPNYFYITSFTVAIQ